MLLKHRVLPCEHFVCAPGPADRPMKSVVACKYNVKFVIVRGVCEVDSQLLFEICSKHFKLITIRYLPKRNTVFAGMAVHDDIFQQWVVDVVDVVYWKYIRRIPWQLDSRMLCMLIYLSLIHI